ncbi:MAG: hypothetical protein V4675_09830 [Verrucomicrobiota bacterium]
MKPPDEISPAASRITQSEISSGFALAVEPIFIEVILRGSCNRAAQQGPIERDGLKPYVLDMSIGLHPNLDQISVISLWTFQGIEKFLHTGAGLTQAAAITGSSSP